MTIFTALYLSGHFDTEAFRLFAQNRARLLSIRVSAAHLDCRRIVFLLHGVRDLIDMFIMACVLGPANCLVTDWNEEGLP